MLSASPLSPKVYCEAIVNVLASEYASRQSTPALAVTGSVKRIKDRMTTMLTPNRSFRRRPSRVAVVTTLLVAACVLPTSLGVTKANEEKKQAALQTYSFGGRIEVLALGTDGEQPQKWWDTEGRPLAAVPFTWQLDEKSYPAGLISRKVVLRIHNLPEDARVSWTISNSEKYWGGNVLIDGKHRPGYFAKAFGVPKDARTTDFDVGVAAGPWKTLAKLDGSRAQSSNGVSIVVSEPVETASGTSIIVSHDCFDRAVRIVAVDKQGTVHPQLGWGGTSVGKIAQMKAAFPKLPRANIDHYEFQVRDFEWIELNNLPLEPTEAGVALTSFREQTPSTESMSSAKPPVSSTWKSGQTMDLQVINGETKEPLADVTLELQNMGPGIDFADVKTQKTDADGRSRIPFPDLPPTAIRIYPVKEGFVPLRVYWEGEPHPTMPASLTVPMEPARKFGGIIRNEAGEPIPDVTVTVDYWAVGKGVNPHIRANINSTAKTDSTGRWHIGMPAKLDDKENLRIFVSHPGYVSDSLKRGMLPIPSVPQPAISELFAQTAVMTMHRGATIEGTVVDQQGRPISAAALYDNEYYWFGSEDFSSGKPRATTDKSGKFRLTGASFIEHPLFPFADRRGLVLTVQAKGFAPELATVDPANPTINVRLKPGQTAHGKVVDQAGKPVEGARISAGD